jgi:RHS repeat-associated protein
MLGPRMKPIWAALAGCSVLIAAMLPPAVQAAGPTVSPSGAGTVVIGPQAMEGNLQIHPGDPLRAGFDFTMPGSHPAATATIYNGSVSFAVQCSNGATPALAIDLPAQTITDPAGSPSWYPSGDQSSSLVYQGSLTAPDLCAGGVMNDANGATFTATFFSTDTVDKVNFRFHYSDNTAGGWSGTVQGIPTPFAKTVTTAAVTPALGLALSTDHTTAIPGDTISYTATVTNTGSTLTVGGDFVASATGSGTATVVSYWDDISTSPDGTTWTPLAGSAAATSGYTPAVAAPITTGMTLSPTSVVTTGVTYPSSGDRILGTTIGAGDTATWHYAASVPLTPAQAAALVDPTKTKKVRNSFHLEVSPANPNVTQPSIVNVDYSNLFFGAGPSASVSNVKVTIQPPQNAAPLVFNSTNTPALAALAPGASAPVTGTFQVPVPAAKGSLSDSDYFTSLSAVEGTVLTASATASGTAPTGTITAAAPPNVSTTEHLPIVSIKKSGPAQLNPGDTETNPLTLINNGGATAASLTVIDAVTGGGTGTVSGVPASLAAGVSASAGATYPVPASQPGGSLTDTASVSWTDANGNAYGSLSSSFTTQVLNILSGATLTLAPTSAGPNLPGTNQLLTATLLDSHGNPISGQLVHFTIVTGVNSASGMATTDLSGNASFTYAGTNSGTDFVQATVTGPGITISSNQSIVTWLRQLQPVSTTVVTGNFFRNDLDQNTTAACDFGVGPGSTPVFSQTFPNIMFNPDPGIFKIPAPFIPSNNNFTRPFTDVTTDVNGNPNGQIVAQGNGVAAGSDMINFFASFTGSFVVNQPGDLTFRILHDDGYILGVGGSATRVSGDFDGDTVPATTPFNGYPTMAAWNTTSTGSSSSGPATIHFPAAGVYPFELDYTECKAGPLFLDLLTQQFTAQTSPLSIYVGYADGLRAGGSIFPFPWNGSPNTTFEGCTGCTYDGGAIRIDNSGTTAAQIDNVTVDIPMAPGVTYCPTSTHFDIWPHNLTIPAGQTLILGPMANGSSCGPPETFDTSDTSFYCGPDTGVIPLVNLTSGGVTTTFKDSTQVLNTGGRDVGVCTGNESESWQRIGGGGTAINLPVPPAATLNLTPFNVPGATQGQSITLTVAALDGGGNPAANLPVTLQVNGANTQSQTKPTDTGGLVTFTYTGSLAGTDSVEASAFVQGLRAISNAGTVVWIPPGGTNNPLAPSITAPTPADGSVVTKPVAVTATITPPSGQTIASWRVFYQALDPGSPVTIASGTGTPPSPLATFDPTVLPNDTYGITVEATASNGAVQDLTTTVTVLGDLKPGRYTTTYQDLSVPVGGFQMEVRRTYDSIDKSAGDFGVGWKVNIANFRVASNRILGAGGWTQYNSSCTLGLCFTAFKNSAQRFVTVTFPDQHTEVFDFTPGGGTNIFWSCTPHFTARGSIGTTSTLVPLDDTSCSYTGDGNIYGANGLYSPKQFQLTTKDGRVLILSAGTGLVSETDNSGNSLSVSATGVKSTLGPASNPTPGPSITFARDGQGRITDVYGPVSGQHLRYSYFPSGPNELQVYTDAAGHSSTYSYDATTGDLALSTDANNQPLETLRYDSSGRLTSIANGTAPPTLISTSPNLQQQTFLDPSGNLTTILTLDDLGDVIEQDQAFGGQPALQTLFTYDSAGRLTSVTDQMKHTTSATYDETNTSANGELLTSTDAVGRTYTYLNYTSFGQPGSVLKPDGSVLITYTYDAMTGALIASQQPGQNPTTYQYYPSGLLQSTADPGGRSEQYTYDINGHLKTAADSQGTAVTFSVDSAGNVNSVTDQLGNQTLYQYNPDGTLAILTDGDLNTWQFFYDVQGRMKQIKDSLGKSTLYEYNSLGQLSRRTDRNGAITNFTYDVDDNLTQIARPNNDIVNFTYDPLSRLTETDNSSSHVDRTYDAASHLTSESTCANTGSPQISCSAVGATTQPTVSMAYSWFPDDLLKSVTSSDAGSIQYAYDGLGHLKSITDPALAVTGYGYDSLGRLSSITRPNGVNDLFGYNASGDLTSRDSYLNGNLVARSDYVIDPVTGRRASSTNMTGTTSYTYYANGLLHSATHPAASGIPNESYAYDAAGNRTSTNGQPATFGADRLLSNGQFNYTYDADGHLTAKTPVGGGAGTTYSWDAEGELTSITYPDGSASSYRYDPFGRRIASVDPAGETRYVWNSFSVHADYSSQNQLMTSYVPGPTFGAPLEQSSGSQTLYYLADGQNNPSALTNGSGQAVGSYAFNAFGVPQPGNASSNRYSFGGYQQDSASGLYYAGARYYDPSAGRFISEDPQAAVNPYPYAANDPVDLLDPLGQQAFREYVARLQAVALQVATFLVRVGCGLLNLLALIGLISFAIEGLSPFEKGVLGEDWLGKATGGLGRTGVRVPTPGGTHIPDRVIRPPGVGDIFLDAKNAAAIDARSVAQLTDLSAEGPVIILTRTSLRELPTALRALAARGLLKWVKCFPA